MKIKSLISLSFIFPFNNISSLQKLIIIKKNYIQRNFDYYLDDNKVPCAFCKGNGFIKCKCEKGCWRCNDTLFATCHFCNGSGKGKRCYQKIK